MHSPLPLPHPLHLFGTQFELVDVLAQPASSLSQSDLRRVFAAAAFVSTPGVVLMDEVRV